VRVVTYDSDGSFEITPDPFEPPGQRAWLSWSSGDRTVLSLVDTTTGAVLAEFDLPFQGGGLDSQDLGLPGIDEREVGPAWVSNPNDDTVWQLDPIGRRIVRKIRVGRHPTGIDLSERDNAVWVANSWDGTVSRIDATTGEVVATIPVGGSPQSVHVGEGGVWVSVYPA
jgi:YVTN family beta-propeller protein